MATIFVSVTEAKRQLSKLINLVLAGEEVIITRYKKPVAKLIPYVEKPE
ncbi:MAG: Antitoxin Phd YefM, type toxin-antitoxin system [Holophagaceae bacterium]|nr:Antitoxin Phd YefM, type toxin-antitoxin system [Holophagaceae bacterium]